MKTIKIQIINEEDKILSEVFINSDFNSRSDVFAKAYLYSFADLQRLELIDKKWTIVPTRNEN